eukprot:TRINITY_DN14644_c0_g4_i1.p1 TRINITY_DN14644_c0_g4~~TRINITY_DN14644_c0_g4_i1.p1  ORF type:complete len:625 (-),score=77.07 TRINITY_DN14644_c0_g4_i1:77-1810(-)
MVPGNIRDDVGALIVNNVDDVIAHADTMKSQAQQIIDRTRRDAVIAGMHALASNDAQYYVEGLFNVVAQGLMLYQIGTTIYMITEDCFSNKRLGLMEIWMVLQLVANVMVTLLQFAIWLYLFWGHFVKPGCNGLRRNCSRDSQDKRQLRRDMASAIAKYFFEWEALLTSSETNNHKTWGDAADLKRIASATAGEKLSYFETHMRFELPYNRIDVYDCRGKIEKATNKSRLSEVPEDNSPWVGAYCKEPFYIEESRSQLDLALLCAYFWVASPTAWPRVYKCLHSSEESDSDESASEDGVSNRQFAVRDIKGQSDVHVGDYVYDKRAEMDNREGRIEAILGNGLFKVAWKGEKKKPPEDIHEKDFQPSQKFDLLLPFLDQGDFREQIRDVVIEKIEMAQCTETTTKIQQFIITARIFLGLIAATVEPLLSGLAAMTEQKGDPVNLFNDAYEKARLWYEFNMTNMSNRTNGLVLGPQFAQCMTQKSFSASSSGAMAIISSFHGRMRQKYQLLLLRNRLYINELRAIYDTKETDPQKINMQRQRHYLLDKDTEKELTALLGEQGTHALRASSGVPVIDSD